MGHENVATSGSACYCVALGPVELLRLPESLQLKSRSNTGRLGSRHSEKVSSRSACCRQDSRESGGVNEAAEQGC